MQHTEGLSIASIVIRLHTPELRARARARLFRIGEIFSCHSGGRSQSLVWETVEITKPLRVLAVEADHACVRETMK